MAGHTKEASDMLAEALKQLDNVLASTKFETHNGGTELCPRKSRSSNSHISRVAKIMVELRNELESFDDKKKLLHFLPSDLVWYIRKWVSSEALETSEQIREEDSQLLRSLLQQGHQLDQLMAQENASQDNGYLSDSMESKIHKLETDKQSLSLQVTVLSEQVEAQGEKIRELEFNLDERRKRLIVTEDMLQSELLTRTSLETHKLDLMAEISSLKIKLASADKDRRDLDERLRVTQRQMKELESKLAVRDAEITELRQRLVRNGTVLTPDSNGDCSLDRTLEREKTIDRLKRKQYEVEKLKKAVDALMFSNQEKDKRIDDLRKLLRRYKKIEEMVVQAQGRKALEDMMVNAEDDTSSTSSTTPSIGENVNRDQQYDQDRTYQSQSSASTPVHSFTENGLNTGTSTVLTTSTPKRSQGLQRSNSAEDITPTNQKKKSPTNNNHHDSSFRGSSSSSFAHTEVVTDDEDGLQHIGTSRPPDIKKKKGFKSFFGKLKRSGSQDFHERQEQFKRGGVRATASGRLGWSRDIRLNDDTPFNRWDNDRVTLWINDIGLNMYVSDCRRWVKNGDHLLKATPHDIEKELGIKNCLHKKKLMLALQEIQKTGKMKKEDLDHNWITRWLDDIGLPQYKDNFYDARIDGRMLQYLTVDDLLALKVTNELHHISIKRGIQVLHVHGFNPQCLRRRPSPDEGQLHNIPADVALWTNHRVMEWLRTIDLSEYAPNLRGSGVHGALMVLEPRFNAELFAMLLSIPQNKTLLRRHLSTHFVALVGNETQHKKREQETLPGYIPLLPSAKVKSKKFGIFGHKRNKSDADADDFICPDFTRRGAANGRSHNKEQDEKAAKEIGAFSKEINTLTDMLSKDKFLDNVPTSNV